MKICNKDVEQFQERIKKEAEDLVLKKFPTKMIDLNSLLHSEKFALGNLERIRCDPNIPIPSVPEENVENDNSGESSSKKRKRDDFIVKETTVSGTKVLALTNGIAPCNTHIKALIDIVKPSVIQLVEDANMLKMWISFLIPRIEDGNNFGVSIQEETLAEVRVVETEAATYFDQVSRYYMSRGKIVSKIAKYPHVEDFRRTLEELDEKEFLSLRLVVCELRNHYATLHDIIFKNLEKIKKPRNSNSENMY